MGEILRGKYEIAFFTYDKFLGISAAAPYILNQLGLVVPDEAQFVTDPGRGMVVELLLTSLVSVKQRGVSPPLVAQLFRRYVQGNPEPIRSSVNDGNPGAWVIRLLAQVKNIDRAAII